MQRRACSTIARLVVATLAMTALPCCNPDLADDSFLVDTPRVLAVQAVPAEAAPGDRVTLHALVGDRNGAQTDATLDWTLCRARKPLSELGPVSRACLAPAPREPTPDSELVPLEPGLSTQVTLPRDACRLFGPNPPEPAPGEPAGRPIDPDGTGGFYVPVTVAFGDAPRTLASVRVFCPLAGLTQRDSAELTRRYRRNTNPAIASLLLVPSGSAEPLEAPQDGSGQPPTVRVGQAVRLNAGWASCASDAESCTGAELYARFDVRDRRIVMQREAMRISWLTTAGALSPARSGRDATDSATEADTLWTAPDVPGDVVLFVVARDDRGGSSFSAHRVHVVAP